MSSSLFTMFSSAILTALLIVVIFALSFNSLSSSSSSPSSLITFVFANTTNESNSSTAPENETSSTTTTSIDTTVNTSTTFPDFNNNNSNMSWTNFSFPPTAENGSFPPGFPDNMTNDTMTTIISSSTTAESSTSSRAPSQNYTTSTKSDSNNNTTNFNDTTSTSTTTNVTTTNTTTTETTVFISSSSEAANATPSDQFTSSTTVMTTTVTTSIIIPTNNNNNNGFSTTVAAGLPPSSSFTGFFAIFRPVINITKRSSSSSSSSNATLQELARLTNQRLVTLLTTVPDLSAHFNGAFYRAKLAAALRQDLSIKLSMPAADIGVDSFQIVYDSTMSMSGDNMIGVTFRVSQVRGKEITAALTQILSNQLADDASWTESMNLVLTDAANLVINTTASLRDAGIEAAEIDNMVLRRASPDDSATTSAAPVSASGTNPACFVSNGDCAGTGIVIAAIVILVIVLVASVKVFWDFRGVWASQAKMEAQFAKEVENRSAIRQKVLEGKQQMEKEDLSNTLKKREQETRERQVQEALEMEEIKQEHLRAQEYQRQQAIIQQQQAVNQAKLNTQQRHDNHHLQQGLLGDPHSRARQYEVQNYNNDALAQTAPTPHHHYQQQQQQYNSNMFEYDDIL